MKYANDMKMLSLLNEVLLHKTPSTGNSEEDFVPFSVEDNHPQLSDSEYEIDKDNPKDTDMDSDEEPKSGEDNFEDVKKNCQKKKQSFSKCKFQFYHLQQNASFLSKVSPYCQFWQNHLF